MKRIAETFELPFLKVSSSQNFQEALQYLINYTGDMLVELEIDKDFRVIPQVKFGCSVEDMEPLLDRTTFERHMITVKDHNKMIPSKIKAAVLFEKEHNPQIVELDLPELMFGQVLVKVIYSGVCRSQIMEVKGLRGEDVWLPHLLGHEAFWNCSKNRSWCFEIRRWRRGNHILDKGGWY